MHEKPRSPIPHANPAGERRRRLSELHADIEFLILGNINNSSGPPTAPSSPVFFGPPNRPNLLQRQVCGGTQDALRLLCESTEGDIDTREGRAVEVENNEGGAGSGTSKVVGSVGTEGRIARNILGDSSKVNMGIYMLITIPLAVLTAVILRITVKHIQMVRIDETQEAIARIRMAVDESNKARVTDIEGDSDAGGDDATPSSSPQDGSHWKLGAPEKLLNSHQFEECMVAEGRGCEFQSFDSRLRAFLTSVFPENAVSYEDLIQVRSFRCLYVQYQSLEDWTEAQDILRCNADFHKRERYDSVIINTDSQKLAVARLRALLRCILPTGRVVDVGFVRLFRQHRWRPSTFWGGCKIFEESAVCDFILMDYVVRGALLSPVFDTRGKGIHYAIDTVDSDMFLRINGW